MTALRRLVLWDVDGTLVRAGPAARDAFARAVADVVGCSIEEVADHGVQMAGGTDPVIALEILANLAIDDDQAHRHLPAVLEGLVRELAVAEHRIRAEGWVLPGIRELLARLAARGDVVQSVLTGNLAPNAVVKLAAFRLDRFLRMELGAYGSDRHQRDELVPVALDKVERATGHRFDPRDVWVVGDTPKDLACARAAGTRCLLVATGVIPLEDLEHLGADTVLADLSDVDAVEHLLTG
ncbi:MAG TPA: HAD family hydrolase [Acidimicrobiales bacterium]|nr:HAD family hydrolase [Acidimicrobiales bacterium]